MRIRFAVLLLLTATVARAVVLGPELPVPPPLLGEANGAQEAVIASGGDSSLAAWLDFERNGLYVTTIALDGTVAAPARRIYGGLPSGISVCWTGAAYLVTWYDDSAGLLAISLARDGGPTGAPRLVAPAGTFTRSGALAWNGQHAFLACYTSTSSSAVILDAQGNVIRSDIALPNTSSEHVVATGSTFCLFLRTLYLVPVPPPGVSHYEEAITVVRFAGDGTPVDTSPTLVSRTGVLADSWGVASDGNRLALVEVEQQSQSQAAPALRRFLIDSQTLASQQLPAIGVNAPSGAAVTWNGGMFIAVWPDYGNSSTSAVMTLPFSGGADVQPGAILTEDGTASYPIATFNGRNVVAAWLRRTTGLSSVAGILLDPTATRTASERFTISTGNQWQVSPALAPSLAVWVESEGDSANDVFAARATDTGYGLRVRVSTSSQATGSSPAVAFTGDTYLVVWQETPPYPATTRLMARRLRLDGTPLDDQAMLLTDSGSDPSLAFNGSIVLLAYADGRISFVPESNVGGGSSFVHGIRFDRSGNKLDTTPFVISVSDSGAEHGASVASDGTGFLVVWRYDPAFFCCSDPPPPPAPPPPPQPSPEVLGVRVTAAGAVLDSPPLTIGRQADVSVSPVAAWSGTGYLVASGTLTGTVTSITAQRLLDDGTISGAPVTVGDPLPTFPVPMAMAADATGCWISWSDTDVHLAHIAASGIDVAPMVIATGAVSPAFAPGSIAYSRTDSDQTIVVVRDLPAHPRRRPAGH